MELTTQSNSGKNTQAIILSTGTHHLISDFELEKIRASDLQDMVKIDSGAYIKASSILEVMPLSEYYEKYPDKKPTQRYYENNNSYTWDEIKQLRGKGIDGIIESSPNKGLELMAKGLKNWIEKQNKKGISTLKANSVLEKMRLTYAQKNLK